MASDQNMIQAITQVATEAPKAARMAVREAEDPAKSRRPAHAVSRAIGPALRKPIFDWEAQNKYDQLNNFKIQVRNIFMMTSYNT